MAKEIKTEWDLSLLVDDTELKNLADLREEVKKANYKFIDKWKNRLDFLEKAEILKEALDDLEKLESKYSQIGKEGTFIILKKYLEEDNSEVKAEYNKFHDFEIKVFNDIQFFTIKLSKITEAKQREFLDSQLLKDYKHTLDKLFKSSKHILSDSEEKIMNLKGKTSHSNWSNMIESLLSKQEREVLDEDGKKSKKNLSLIMSLIDNKNKKVRDSAADALNEIFEKYAEVAEYEINSIVEDKKNNDEIRKYKYVHEATLLNDDVEKEVFDSLRESVKKRFDIGERYYKLKAKLLGFEKLDYHERNLEVGRITFKYSIKESYELVKNVFSNLDPEFGEIVERFFQKGQVDVFPKKGKHNGAFCLTILKSLPTFILLNFDNSLDDVRTLAHELGHAINSELSTKQNALNFHYSISTAEVASTFFEDFVLDEVANKLDDEGKLTLKMSKLNTDISTIIRQIAAVNFEIDLHREAREKGYLSKEEIGKLFLEHMKSYMGDAVRQNEGSQNWWIYWSHLRRFFYNYSYSFGLLISKALQRKVKEDKSFIKNVKYFLSAGSIKSPKEIFNDIGIDITDKDFWNTGLDEIENLLSETENLAKKLGKVSS